MTSLTNRLKKITCSVHCAEPHLAESVIPLAAVGCSTQHPLEAEINKQL